MLGKLLDGRYQVNQVLGAGGFGRTYLAQDTRRPGNPICVVKHLQPANRDPNFLETARRLFNSEAETLEVLGNHDQIPRLLAYFEEDQEFYLVQEYIEGHPLSQELISGQPWEQTRVVDLLQELLEVLDFVHNHGVIHRDIKPDNLIRRNLDKKLVLLDFGAVKQIRTQLANPQGQMSNTVAVGTPGYMSSEQALGQPRPTSDIYALGIIAIQAITGRMPAELQEDLNTGELIWQHLAPVSPGLKHVLTRMVRYHFKDRYQSAGEALQAVRSLIAASSTHGQPVSPSQPTPQSTPLSQQGTLAVSPAAPPRRPTPPTPPPPPEPEPTSEPNRAPLIIGVGLAVAMAAAGMAYGIRQGLSGGMARGTCTVTAQGLNVRSNPNATVVGTVNKGTKLTLTGTKQGNWVEIRSPRQGWVFDQYIDCSSVDTIAEQPESPTPKETQPSPTPVESKPSPSPEPTPTPTPKKSPDQPKDNGAEILTKATEEYQKGNLDRAIALAQSVVPDSQAFEDAQQQIETMQQEWSEAKAKFDRIQQAYNEGRYVDVIIYAADSDFPEQRYWRQELNKLVRKATQRRNQEDTNQENPPSSEPSNPENSKSETKEPSQPSPKPTDEDSVPICEPEAEEDC